MPRSTRLPYPALGRSVEVRPGPDRPGEDQVGRLDRGLRHQPGQRPRGPGLGEIRRAVQQECRDLHACPTRRSAGLSKSDLDRTDLAKTKSGVWTGAYATNPANDREVPVWVRSEERFSRNAEIYTLALPGARPVCRSPTWTGPTWRRPSRASGPGPTPPTRPTTARSRSG